MEKIRIGVICPSEIAYRRFMPALKKCDNIIFAGISVAGDDEWNGTYTNQQRDAEYSKAQKFIDEYGGRIFSSYNKLLTSDEINAVYLPLPPALHYKWGKFALENGKHIFMEKPFTTSAKDTEELISLAKEKNLAVHENYMFVYHSQLEWIKKQISTGAIGDVRLIRIDFGFPFRGANDFRYKKELGGGALLDCGGYTVKLASVLLGETAKITTSRLNGNQDFDVDIYGSATLVNDDGLTAQISFGMDNSYKCSLEIWGSTGSIYTNRILTAPDGFEPTAILRQGNEEKAVTLPADDTFKKSVEKFVRCVADSTARCENSKQILSQSISIDKVEREQRKSTYLY